MYVLRLSIMGRKPIEKLRRINLSIDKTANEALQKLKAGLAQKRGMPVTEADAIRHAILRAKP